MTERKNPYRGLHAILAALPEDKRLLARATARGAHVVAPDGSVVTCGCALGTAYRGRVDNPRGDLVSLFNRARGATEGVAAAFRDWVEALGGGESFVDVVQRVNDEPEDLALTGYEAARSRYERVLSWLAREADAWDARRATEEGRA